MTMHVGVILPNWVGDVVMATPFLRAIRHEFGSEARITGVMRPHVADVLSGTNWLDQVILFHEKSGLTHQKNWSTISQLRNECLDWMFLLSNSLRMAVLAWLSGAKNRVGYNRNGRRCFLTHKLDPLRKEGKIQPVSAVDAYLKLAYFIGCQPQSPHLELETTIGDERHVNRLWHRFGLNGLQPTVLLNPGGAYGSAKNWPVEYFIDLAKSITDQLDSSVLVVCGPAERTIAEEIEYRANRRQVKSLAREFLSIGLTKACIRRSQLVVSTDSGPRHFAAAFNVPSVSLFGPMDPRWSDNYHAGEVRLQKSLSCSPCSKRTCPLLHHRCMRQLSVQRVFEAVRQQLSRRNTSMAA